MPDPILILGASGGIGAAVARQLAQAGWPLILHGRKRDRLEALREETRRANVADMAIEIADLADEEDCKALCARIRETYRHLTGIVFSIGLPLSYRLAHRTAWTVFQQQMDCQLKAFHFIASAGFPLLADTSHSRRLIAISTEAVLGTPPIKTAPYVAAKAAMTAYAQVIAQEWLGRNVRVHIVAPGLVKTDLVADMPDEYLQSLAEQMPEKRLTSAEDVAAFVAFLFTDAADPLYGTPLRLSRGVRS